MGEVVGLPDRSPREDANARVGMRLLLGAWAMMFGALALSWAFVRAGAVPSARAPFAPAAASAAAILGVTVALTRAIRAAERGARSALSRALLAGAALAIAAVALEAAILFVGRRAGMRDSHGLVALTLVAFHALQLASGAVAIAVLARRAAGGAYGPGRALGLKLWRRYWNAALAVWAFALVALFA